MNLVRVYILPLRLNRVAFVYQCCLGKGIRIIQLKNYKEMFEPANIFEKKYGQTK